MERHSIERIRIANERVAEVLRRLKITKAVPFSYFMFAFHGMNHKGKPLTLYRRKKILRALLRGEAHPSWNEYIVRLEKFADAINNL